MAPPGAPRRPSAGDDEMDLLVEAARFRAAPCRTTDASTPAATVHHVGGGRRAPPPSSQGGHLAAPATPATVAATPTPLDLVGDVVERAPGQGRQGGASTRPLPVAGAPFPRATHRRESKFSLARRAAAAADPADLPQPGPPPPPDAMSDAATLLASMTPDQVAAAQAELAARLPPGALDFFKKRGEKKAAGKQEAAATKPEPAAAKTEPAAAKPEPPAPTPAQACFPPASLAQDSGAAETPSTTTASPPTPPALRIRFSLHGDPVGIAPPSAPPSDALQRDPLRTDAAALGYSLLEAAALARSSLPAQRVAGVGLLAAMAERAVVEKRAGVGAPGDDAASTTWADVLAAARAHATRALVAACGDASAPAATAPALHGLVALLAPGDDEGAVYASAASPARVARCMASRPHEIGAWVTWRGETEEEDDETDANLPFTRDPLAAAFTVAGLGAALARVLAPDADGRSVGDCLAALKLVAAAGLAGGVAAASATAATGARVVDLAGDVDAPLAVRLAAFDAAVHLCTASAAHARLVGDGAAAAAVSTALAAAAATDRPLAAPSLRLWTTLIRQGVPCARLDDVLAGLAPVLFDAGAAPADAATALRLVAAAVASRNDAAISPACAATVAAEATWVLDGHVVQAAGEAWANGDTAPAGRLAAALRLLAVAVGATPGGTLKPRLADALAKTGLAAPEGDGPGVDLIGHALDAAQGYGPGTLSPHIMAATDLVTAVLDAVHAATPTARPPLAAAAWSALAPAIVAAAAAAPAATTEWTWTDAAAAQVGLCVVTALETAGRAAARHGGSVFAAPLLPPDPPPVDVYLSAFRLLPPGADALGVRLLSGAFAAPTLEHAAAAADAAVGALASAPESALARAARGGGAWDEPGLLDVAGLGRDLLAAYAEAWCGFELEQGGGKEETGVDGGQGGNNDAATPLPFTFFPPAGSRLPPPSTWLLTDYGATSGRRDGAAAAGAALTLFLGLEKSGSPCARLPSPADRLPLLLDIATGAHIAPAEPWRDERARWCLAALLKRGVAPPRSMTPATASRAAAHFAADTYGDLLVGQLVARIFLPGGNVAAATAALDALDDGDALWSLPPAGDVEGVGSVSDDIGARLSRALAGGRLSRGVEVGRARRDTPCLVAAALDWTAARCFADDAMLRSFVATAPSHELAALLAWRVEEDGGRLGQRGDVARRAVAGNQGALAKVERALERAQQKE